MIRLAFAACAALLACGAALSQVTLVGRQSFSGSELGASAAATFRLHLTLVRLEGSGWTGGQALAILRETAGILAQCGVAVDRAELQSLSAPDHLDFSTPAARELARAHPVARPAVYLVRDTKSRRSTPRPSAAATAARARS